MKTRSSLALVAAIALVVAVTPAPSRAAAYTFEIYAGNYDPEPDILDDDDHRGAVRLLVQQAGQRPGHPGALRDRRGDRRGNDQCEH